MQLNVNFCFVSSVNIFHGKTAKINGARQISIGAPKKRVEKLIFFFFGVLNHDKMFLFCWSWKCSSMDNLLMQYWACSCKNFMSPLVLPCYLLQAKATNDSSPKYWHKSPAAGRILLHKEQLLAWNEDKFIKRAGKVKKKCFPFALYLRFQLLFVNTEKTVCESNFREVLKLFVSQLLELFF